MMVSPKRNVIYNGRIVLSTCDAYCFEYISCRSRPYVDYASELNHIDATLSVMIRIA